jgi:hypothetical protein
VPENQKGKPSGYVDARPDYVFKKSIKYFLKSLQLILTTHLLKLVLFQTG